MGGIRCGRASRSWADAPTGGSWANRPSEEPSRVDQRPHRTPPSPPDGRAPGAGPDRIATTGPRPMMRRGELAQYPPAEVLRAASSERLTGGLEFDGEHAGLRLPPGGRGLPGRPGRCRGGADRRRRARRRGLRGGPAVRRASPAGGHRPPGGGPARPARGLVLLPRPHRPPGPGALGVVGGRAAGRGPPRRGGARPRAAAPRWSTARRRPRSRPSTPPPHPRRRAPPRASRRSSRPRSRRPTAPPGGVSPRRHRRGDRPDDVGRPGGHGRHHERDRDRGPPRVVDRAGPRRGRPGDPPGAPGRRRATASPTRSSADGSAASRADAAGRRGVLGRLGSVGR